MVKSFLFSSALILSCVATQASALDSAMVDQGSKVYTNHCLHCHGPRGEGDGHLVAALKVKPANLTQLNNNGCVTKRVLGAVLGRHKSGYADSKMPLLKSAVTLEEAYAISEFVETLQN